MKKSLLALTVLSALTVSSFASANQAGDILIRGGATMVNPDSDKTGIDLNGADSGMSLSVDDNTQLGLNFVYFFDSNWAVELLAATPFKHDITVHDPDAVLGVDGVHLAEVTQLPPTLSALYYFDTSSKLKPYVGLGLNYTIFFDEGFEDAPKSLGFSDLDLDASIGYSVQIGADYHINDKWSINASARYIDINTDASFKYNDTVKGSADVDVDPMVYSLMIGYKF
ncbi:OmpW/AlkL family protein [Thalassomonas actiniarum]|uniref:Outer membrane beta-barrel protein n=1 Tax=Thalassomonas actiniarum TaxID=485447 RepID=A0AAE9YPZ5_9GAMM|nr:OmpW family outer membrane protein [Thalassomonas actiniarum]WDD99139.1 outer membrane beta-barrel protein [Thalassomonas actiniarum]